MDNDDDDILLWLLLDSADDDTSPNDTTPDTTNVESDSPDNQKDTKTSNDMSDSLSKVSVTRTSDSKLYNYELSTNNGLPPKESFKEGYTQFFKKVSLKEFKPSNLEGTSESEYTVSSDDKSTVFKIKEIDKQVDTDSLAIKIDPSNENTVYFSQNKITFTHEK